MLDLVKVRMDWITTMENWPFAVLMLEMYSEVRHIA